MRVEYELLTQSLPSMYLNDKNFKSLRTCLLDVIRYNSQKAKKYECSIETYDYNETGLSNLNKKIYEKITEINFKMCFENKFSEVEKYYRELADEVDLMRTYNQNYTKYRYLNKLWQIMSVLDPNYASHSKLSPMMYRMTKEQKYENGCYDCSSDCTILAKSSLSQIRIDIESKLIKCTYYGVNIIDILTLCKNVLSSTIQLDVHFREFEKQKGENCFDLFPVIQEGDLIRLERSNFIIFNEEMMCASQNIQHFVNSDNLSVDSKRYGSIKLPLVISLPDQYKPEFKFSINERSNCMFMLDCWGIEKLDKMRYERSVALEFDDDDMNFDDMDVTETLNFQTVHDLEETDEFIEDMSTMSMKRLERLKSDYNGLVYRSLKESLMNMISGTIFQIRGPTNHKHIMHILDNCYDENIKRTYFDFVLSRSITEMSYDEFEQTKCIEIMEYTDNGIEIRDFKVEEYVPDDDDEDFGF